MSNPQQQLSQPIIICSPEEIKQLQTDYQNSNHQQVLLGFENCLLKSCPKAVSPNVWAGYLGFNAGAKDFKSFTQTGYAPKKEQGRGLLDFGDHEEVWDIGKELAGLPFTYFEKEVALGGMPKVGKIFGSMPLALEFLDCYDQALKGKSEHPFREAITRVVTDVAIDSAAGLDPITSVVINISGKVLAPGCQYVADNFPKLDSAAMSKLAPEIREEISDNYYEMVGNAALIARILEFPYKVKEKVSDAAVFAADVFFAANSIENVRQETLEEYKDHCYEVLGNAQLVNNLFAAKEYVTNYVCSFLAEIKPDQTGKYDLKALQDRYFDKWSELNATDNEKAVFHMYGGQSLNHILQNPQSLVAFANQHTNANYAQNSNMQLQQALATLQKSNQLYIDKKFAEYGQKLNAVLTEQVNARNEKLAELEAKQQQAKEQLFVDNLYAGVGTLALFAQATGHAKLAGKISTIGCNAIKIACAAKSIMNASAFALNPYLAIAQGSFAILNCFCGQGDGTQLALQGISKQIAALHQTVLELHKETMLQFKEVHIGLQKIEYILEQGIKILSGKIVNVDMELRRLHTVCNFGFYLLNERLIKNQNEIMDAFSRMTEDTAVQQLITFQSKINNPNFKQDIWEIASEIKPIATKAAKSVFLTKSNIDLKADDKVMSCCIVEPENDRLNISMNLGLIAKIAQPNLRGEAINPYIWIAAAAIMMNLFTREGFKQTEESSPGAVLSNFIQPLVHDGRWLAEALTIPSADVFTGLIDNVIAASDAVETHIKALMQQYSGEINQEIKKAFIVRFENEKQKVRTQLKRDLKLEHKLASQEVEKQYTEFNSSFAGKIDSKTQEFHNAVNAIKIDFFGNDSVFLHQVISVCYYPEAKDDGFLIPFRDGAEPISSSSDSQLFQLLLRAETMGCGQILASYNFKKHEHEKSVKHDVNYRLRWRANSENEWHEAGAQQTAVVELNPQYLDFQKAYLLSYGINYCDHRHKEHRKTWHKSAGIEAIQCFTPLNWSEADVKKVQQVLESKYSEYRSVINGKIKADFESVNSLLYQSIQKLLAQASLMFQVVYCYIYEWARLGVKFTQSQLAIGNILQSLGCALITRKRLLSYFDSYNGANAAYSPLQFCAEIKIHCQQLKKELNILLSNLSRQKYVGSPAYQAVKQMLDLIDDYRKNRLVKKVSLTKKRKTTDSSEAVEDNERAKTFRPTDCSMIVESGDCAKSSASTSSIVTNTATATSSTDSIVKLVGSSMSTLFAIPKDSLVSPELQIRNLHALWEAMQKVSSSSSSRSMLDLKTVSEDFGYACHNVEGDGNCFYRAVAHQIQSLQLNVPALNGRTLNHETIRALTVQHVIDNLNLYRDSFVGNPNELVLRASTPGEWADHVFILGCARVLNLNLAIIRNTDSDHPNIFCRRNPVGTIYLGYEDEVHYQSLLLNRGLIPTKNIQGHIARAQISSIDNWEPEQKGQAQISQSRA